MQNMVIVGKTALPMGSGTVVIWGNVLQLSGIIDTVRNGEECYSVELFPTKVGLRQQRSGVRKVFSDNFLEFRIKKLM